MFFYGGYSIASTDTVEMKIYFSPDKINEQVVSSFIKQTKNELLIEAYSITNSTIAKSIADIKKKGIKVSLICDKANAKKSNDYCTKLGGKTDNRSGLMHNKVMIRDNQCVLTGSFNFTNNAVYNNRENFIIICNDKIAETYKNQFNIISKYNDKL